MGFSRKKQAVVLDGDSIEENFPALTKIGIFSTYEKNASAISFQYELINDAGGRFKIGGKNKNELLATQSFDYEEAKFYEIEVKTTQTDPSDPNFSSIPYDESEFFLIRILDDSSPNDPNDPNNPMVAQEMAL
ncbi:MAG: cadherin repeat domain-containing protein [Richelia sp. SL_2_1]|nr:cadherin repeat domain-containing protein [Richelia sp. SL_2_1]